jgi:hypothetical protein
MTDIVEFESDPDASEWDHERQRFRYRWCGKISVALAAVTAAKQYGYIDGDDSTATTICVQGGSGWMAINCRYSEFKAMSELAKRGPHILTGTFVSATEEVPVAADTLRGIPAIAAFLGLPERVVYYRAAQGLLPIIKIGDTWELRKSRYRKFIERLETEAEARRAAKPESDGDKRFGRGRRRPMAEIAGQAV